MEGEKNLQKTKRKQNKSSSESAFVGAIFSIEASEKSAFLRYIINQSHKHATATCTRGLLCFLLSRSSRHLSISMP
jgi:hypothetical protein